ncbi:MAG: sodium:proton antiporter [Prevotellaceae bacterium]|jgi:Na+/H+ antiporter NhaD/arsenite permease-like protein|nr:sodium:proton antiporter [Prevotellaceae bacterium]
MIHLPLITAMPFVLMLLSIAVVPLFAGHFWESNRNKFFIVLALSVPTVVYLLLSDLTHELEHQIFADYVPFIVLLATLFTVTGGIHLSGDLMAKPLTNTLFLFIGFVLASVMGTTGAAMMLIRPLINTNQQRKYKTHTVLFFIAVVANCGGLLTPLGDPPLLLLYLRGVPFEWFMHLFPMWFVSGVLLLTIYYFVDSYYFKKEQWTAISADLREKTPLRIGGKINFVYLLLVVLSVAFINDTYFPQMKEHDAPFYLTHLRDIVLVVLAGLSWFTTKKRVRHLNFFSWSPILEVAILFFGIFVTMCPALLLLREHAVEFGLTQSWHFYYATGLLSAFLDNAPTAIVFYNVGVEIPAVIPLLHLSDGTITQVLLEAIAVGAVFFGSLTYIGNGPNFMIKAIADEQKIPMPSFFGYMFKFSFVVLLPVYVLVQLIFF